MPFATESFDKSRSEAYLAVVIMFFKLLILFILIPVAELYLFLTLGEEIGIWATLGIIVATAFIGAALTRSQGARAMQRFREAAAQGRMPAKEALDGLLILVAGVVLLTPGFLTDAFGFLLLIPPARAVIRSVAAPRAVVRPAFLAHRASFASRDWAD